MEPNLGSGFTKKPRKIGAFEGHLHLIEIDVSLKVSY